MKRTDKKTAREALAKVKQILSRPFERGGSARLAKGLNLTKGAVSQWDVIPGEHVLKVEELVAQEVTRYAMRPDIYGQAPQ